jgi:hypothetical protein
MTRDIIAEIQAERAQIQVQERSLNIKKIQLAIKELYTAFEDGQVIDFHDEVLFAVVEDLKKAVYRCQTTKDRFDKGLNAMFVNSALSQGLDFEEGDD